MTDIHMNYPDKNFEAVAPGVEPQDAERAPTVLSSSGGLKSNTHPFAHRFSPARSGKVCDRAWYSGSPRQALFKPDARRRLDNTVLRISWSRVLAEPEFSSPWKAFVLRHTTARFWEQITQHYASEIRALHPGLEQALGRPLEEWRAVRRGSGETGDVSLECHQIVVNTAVTATPSAVKAPHMDHVKKL